MEVQADLGDLQSLERLAEVLERLAPITRQTLAEAEADAMPRLRRIEQRLASAEEACRRAETAAENADDENRASLERWAEEARERVDELRRAAERVERALSRYRDAARGLRELDRAVLSPARSFLSRKASEARDYLAVRIDGAPAADGAPSLRREAGTTNPWGPDLPGLPGGFAWIPVASIEPPRPGDPPLEWKKGITREVMAIGLGAFAGQIIPRLRAGPIDRDELRAADRAAGRATGGAVPADSLDNLHEVFFGSDSIAASRLPDGRYTLLSGRHRTEVARSLGWSHVPVRMDGGV